MSTNNDSNTSTAGVSSGEETPPSSSLEDVLDVLTLAPSSSSPADKSTNGMHFANSTVADLSADEIAIVFSYLPLKEIMRARVCTTWRDAAKKTLVPVSDFCVNCIRSYNALRIMSSALPNLQQVSIRSLGEGSKYNDGEDPHESLATLTAKYATHDLNVISNFRNLLVLDVNDSLLDGRFCTFLNGRYPVLFNFPMLQSLTLENCWLLKWDLDMLSGCPLLRELGLNNQSFVTGDLKSLRVMKNTLETVDILHCHKIHGNFMELADFPCLKKLWIYKCPIMGDIRDIKEDDFPSLGKLRLPSTVIGGFCYKFQRISDVPSFMHAIYPLLKRFPETFNHESRYANWRLSKDSADWYVMDGHTHVIDGHTFYEPPFKIDCILAEGLRCGWRWSVGVDRHACEVNWLDPEPSEDSDGYDKYVECLQKINDETGFYRGYYEPPTEEEYRRLCLRERED